MTFNLTDLYGVLASPFKYMLFTKDDIFYILSLTEIDVQTTNIRNIEEGTICNPMVIFSTDLKNNLPKIDFTHSQLYAIIQDRYTLSLQQQGVVNVTNLSVEKIIEMLNIYEIAKNPDYDKLPVIAKVTPNYIGENLFDTNNAYCFSRKGYTCMRAIASNHVDLLHAILYSVQLMETTQI